MIEILEAKPIPTAEIVCNNCGSKLRYSNCDLCNDKSYVTCENGNLQEIKIGQKFKVGDLIKHNKANIICKVISVNIGSYYVENIKTGGRIELFNAEQNFHLWTIQDAKDGDVLVGKDGRPFIFTGELDVQDDNPTAYCGINHSDNSTL